MMMDVPLTIPLIARHAEALHGAKIVASRLPDHSVRRLTYNEVLGRARRLASALKQLGVREIFTPGASTEDIVKWVRENVQARQ